MTTMNALENAKQLKAELDSFRPLIGEIEARIMQKFRLDWNYHSNNLEGNSLTYGETKALILFGITAQGKPLKDHFEITGHNEAINWVVDLVKGETELTEVFIRQLHELLLKESHYKEAVTSEGKQTRRKIEVGKYKTQPNHVITVTGETFFFATPEETPIKMQELIDWFRKERDKTGVNPIILASLFHYKFIRIHPFDDGNGRTARILMNFILMQFGFPPVIIRTEDKENYYRVLRLADADELEPFIEYIAENLVRSLEIMLKGAKGESIEEPDDFAKKIALFDFSLKSIGIRVDEDKNKEAIIRIFDESVILLTHKLTEESEKFNRFYLYSGNEIYVKGKYRRFEELSFESAKEKINELDTEISELGIRYFHATFNTTGFGGFNYTSSIVFRFKVTEYDVFSSKGGLKYQKTYSELLTEQELNNLVKAEAESHLNQLQEKKRKFEESLSKKINKKTNQPPS
jgi:Fic family protein